MALRQMPIDTLEEGLYADSVYLVRRRQLARSKAGRFYLNLVLSDKTGEIVARMFNKVEAYAHVFNEGDFIEIQGRVQTYEGKLQIVLDALSKVETDSIDPQDFLPAGRHDSEDLFARLRALLESIEEPKIRELCLAALDDETIGRLFKVAPAAQSMHHPFIGGLLEHTLSVMLLLDVVSRHYQNVNRSVILAGGFFHDIGKIRELVYETALGYSDEGRLIPHLIIGVQIVDDLVRRIGGMPEDLRLQIEHIILSHHGTREFGSPVIPATVEAIIVHQVDDLDAKVYAYQAHLEQTPDDATWSERHFLLGTHIRRTNEATKNLYGYHLDGPRPKPGVAAKSNGADSSPKKKAAPKTDAPASAATSASEKSADDERQVDMFGNKV
ncbi:HD domain-containing protein [bacterium]|nr:HD domain-containing protein [bacterium]